MIFIEKETKGAENWRVLNRKMASLAWQDMLRAESSLTRGGGI